MSANFRGDGLMPPERQVYHGEKAVSRDAAPFGPIFKLRGSSHAQRLNILPHKLVYGLNASRI